MSEYWRELLYPLGFLSALAFSARMLLQWLKSEAKGESVVMPAFWKLSLCGNILLAVHSFIQMQFHVCIIQVCNAVISWRNLNLMQPLSFQITSTRCIQILLVSLCITISLFALQDYFFFNNNLDWFRIPSTPWQTHNQLHLPFWWHLIGFIGLILFNSRFWVQWWGVEKHKVSYLGTGFWWCSVIGEGLCLVYFLRIKDPVNFIGPAFGLIPYIRNLMLIYKNKKPLAEVQE